MFVKKNLMAVIEINQINYISSVLLFIALSSDTN